jgi:hypothetical protein
MNSIVASALRDTLTIIDEKIHAVCNELDALNKERAGVVAALRRYSDDEILDIKAAPPSNLHHYARVLTLLSKTEMPLSVTDISEALHLTRIQARSALSYLHKQHKVARISRGVWDAVPYCQA